jgi:tRNA-dihydrouridine synthase B
LVNIGNIPLGEFPLILAPMEDITDSPFRSICKDFGADVVVSEFISSEGLIRDAVKSQSKMLFEEKERPVGIQIFGHNVDSMERAAELAVSANPDFIDINYGCPVKKIVVKGAGAALLKDIPKMLHMTRAVVGRCNIPVTVKTRLGWDEGNKPIVDLAERLQDTGIAAIGIHGRTAVQLYGGKADWTLIGEVKNNPRMKIPVFGNGDITGGAVALEMKNRYHPDGIMIGRAATGNPWIFAEIRQFLSTGTTRPLPTLEERTDVLVQHINKSILYKGEYKTILELRKFYSGYFRGISDFKPYRMRLVTTNDITEIFRIIGEVRQREA